MTKRSPEQILDAIDAWDEDGAIDAEMERVLAETPEEREKELRAAGVDVEAERAKARAWREKAAGELPPIAEQVQEAAPAASPQAEAARPRVIVGGAAAGRASERRSRAWWGSRSEVVAVAALAASILVVLAWPSEEPPVSHGRPHDDGQQGEPTPRGRAEALRQKASAACDRGAWAECKASLDEAQALDPAGESDPRVKGSREAIRRANGP